MYQSELLAREIKSNNMLVRYRIQAKHVICGHPNKTTVSDYYLFRIYFSNEILQISSYHELTFMLTSLQKVI